MRALQFTRAAVNNIFVDAFRRLHTKKHLFELDEIKAQMEALMLECTVMPFGLKNAPATFQRVIRQIIFKYQLKNVENYFDDIIVFSETFEEHIRNLEQLLQACQSRNIKLKELKCKFAMSKINYLGIKYHRIPYHQMKKM